MATSERGRIFNKKLWWTGLGLMAIIAIVSAAVIASQGSYTLTLHRYYPASTVAFVELSAGDALNKNILSLAQAQQESLKKVPAQGKLSPERFLRFSKAANTLFKPEFSVGFWPKTTAQQPQEETAAHGLAGEDKIISEEDLEKKAARLEKEFSQEMSVDTDEEEAIAQKPPSPKEMQSLAIFTLKNPKTTTEEVLKKMDADPVLLKKGRHGKVNYLAHGVEGTAFTVVNGHFLAADSEPALKAALDTYADHANIFNSEETRKYIDRLSGSREGTFILNNSPFVGRATINAPGVSVALQERMKALANIAPLTVGSLDVEGGDIVRGHSLTPVNFAKVTEPELKAALKELYRETSSFDAFNVLPEDSALVVGLSGGDKLFNLIQNFLISDQDKQGLLFAQMMLAPYELDFQKDIVGLFSGTTVFAFRTPVEGTPSKIPVILVNNTQEKSSTLARLGLALKTMGSAGSQSMLDLKQEQFGSISAQVVSAPRMGLNIGYGPISSSVLALSDTRAMADMARVKDSQAEGLHQNKLYKTLTQRMPDKGNARLFINMTTLSSATAAAPPPPLALAGSLNYAGGKETFEGDFALKLNP